MARSREDEHIPQQEDASAFEPRTPSHTRSNVGRKRVTTPSLARSMPSESHSVKMAAVFREAQNSMQMPTTPCRPTPSSVRASRVPLAQHHLRDVGSPMPIKSRTLPKSPKTPDAQDLSGMDFLSRTESNKENQSPQHSYLQQTPRRPSRTDPTEVDERPSPSSTTISRLIGPIIPARESSTPGPKAASRFLQPSTPSILLSQPPRRKKRPNPRYSATDPRPRKPSRTESPFDLDPDDEGLVPLSPDVTPYRKCNRPKRTRCPSYFDADILDLPSQASTEDEGYQWSEEVVAESKEPQRRKGKVVLGESEAAKELTKQRAFVEDAEAGLFFGQKEA